MSTTFSKKAMPITNAIYTLVSDTLVPSIVKTCGHSTPVWRQNRWATGQYQEFIRKNGCGHCCTAMAARLQGVYIDPHKEFTACRQLWGEPQKDREFPQDHLQSVSGITKILQHYGVKAECFGVFDLDKVQKHFEEALHAGKQIIFWSHPTDDFPENPFSPHEHYVLAVGYTEKGQILIANSSERSSTIGVQLVTIDTIMKALFLGADPIDMTWGERDRYINCAGYVVVG